MSLQQSKTPKKLSGLLNQAKKKQWRAKCTYCKRSVGLVKTAYGKKYHCNRCDASVGIHEGTNKPLGTFANKELRHARVQAHYILDTFWMNRLERFEVYLKLANALGLPSNKCHIGMFDLSGCDKVIEICRKWKEEKDGEG